MSKRILPVLALGFILSGLTTTTTASAKGFSPSPRSSSPSVRVTTTPRVSTAASRSPVSGWSRPTTTATTAPQAVPAPKALPGWGRTASPSTKPGTTPSTTAPKLSAADQALRSKVNMTGGTYQSRAAFQQANKAQYTTHFDTAPSVRPSYIPQTYSSGGSSYTVIYDVRHRGYGYYNGLTWVDLMMQNAYWDSVMAQNNAIAAQQAAAYQQPYQQPVTQPIYSPPPVVHSSWTFGDTILLILAIAVIVILILRAKRL